MTQEIIRSANTATMSRSSAPSIQAHSTIARMETDWGCVSVRTKPYRLPAQATRLVEAPKRHCALATRRPDRWGIILAGGDGVRLRELTQSVWGDYRPKQFCPLLGNRTLLEDARHRAERSVSTEQILYAVTRAHENYYLPSLADRPSQRIVQPSNKGTAPAILSALLRIAQTDPNAIVVILPCDHYYSPESAFTAALESAFEIAGQRSRSVVLLGVEPKSPEVEYGWIEVGEATGGHSELFHVEGFREKPTPPLADALFRAGSLWNTFVMVGRVHAFLEMAWATLPRLLQELESWEVTTLPCGETRIPDAVYNRVSPTDFSRQILSQAADRLLALRVSNVEWSDLGNPHRVLVSLLEKNGSLPGWVKLWPDPQVVPPAANS